MLACKDLQAGADGPRRPLQKLCVTVAGYSARREPPLAPARAAWVFLLLGQLRSAARLAFQKAERAIWPMQHRPSEMPRSHAALGAAGLWPPKLGEAGLHAHFQCIQCAPGSRPISLSPRPVAAAAQPPVCSGARTGACSCPGLPGCEQFHPAYDDQCTLGLAPPPLLLATRPPPPPPLPPAHSSAPLCLPPLCREACTAFAPVPPPEHPTYDVYAVIDAALAEDAGDFGDISTNSTWVLAAVAPRRLASAAAPACLVAAARPAVHCSARAVVQLPGLHTCLLPAPTCRRVPEGTQASATFLAKAQGVLVRSCCAEVMLVVLVESAHLAAGLGSAALQQTLAPQLLLKCAPHILPAAHRHGHPPSSVECTQSGAWVAHAVFARVDPTVQASVWSAARAWLQ